MAKKKSNDGYSDELNGILQRLKDMTGKMDSEQKNFFRSLITGENSMEDLLNATFYAYRQPDYASMGSQVITWLGPFWNAEHDDNKVSLCGFVDEDGKNLSMEQKKKDIREYLYTLFARFDPEEDANEWKLYGPLWLMEKYRMTDCLDIVLEVLRQDAHFFSTYINGVEEYLTALICQLTCDRFDQLDAFLREGGLIPEGKPVVFDALVMAAIRRPECRMRALSVITSYLRYCLDICRQGANPANIERYARALATAHIRELWPQISQIYQELEIPHILYDDVDEIKRVMDDETIPYHVEHDSLNGYLLDLEDETGAGDYGMMPYGDFDIDDDEEEDCFGDIYDTDAPCKRYTLTATLVGAPEPVSRTLQVPSNIYLDSFTHLLMIAFGWKEAPDEYQYENDDEIYEAGESGDYLLADVVWKKNRAATFDIMRKGSVLWHHSIVLEKEGKYTDTTVDYIKLHAAYGTYPNRSTKSMTEHARRFASGKVRTPDFSRIADNIEDFALSYEPPV